MPNIDTIVVLTSSLEEATTLANYLGWRLLDVHQPVNLLLKDIFPNSSEKNNDHNRQQISQVVRGLNYTALIQTALRTRKRIKIADDDSEEYENEKVVIYGLKFVPEIEYINESTRHIIQIGGGYHHFISKQAIDHVVPSLDSNHLKSIKDVFTNC